MPDVFFDIRWDVGYALRGVKENISYRASEQYIKKPPEKEICFLFFVWFCSYNVTSRGIACQIPFLKGNSSY